MINITFKKDPPVDSMAILHLIQKNKHIKLAGNEKLRIERAMALLRRGDLSVTDVCFEVGCSSLGTFSSRFTELVGVPPSVYRRDAARSTAGMPSCVAQQVTRPVRNREAARAVAL